jgi:hypothetical protein
MIKHAKFMENKNLKSFIIIVIFIFILGLIIGFVVNNSRGYKGITAEEWYKEYRDETNLNQQYKEALEEANSNIDDANSNIDLANEMINEAKETSGEAYDDMQTALDSLENISTVSNVYEPIQRSEPVQNMKIRR